MKPLKNLNPMRSSVMTVAILAFLSLQLEMKGQTINASATCGNPTTVSYSISYSGTDNMIGASWSIYSGSGSLTDNGSTAIVDWTTTGTVKLHYILQEPAPSYATHEDDTYSTYIVYTAGTASYSWSRCYNSMGTLSLSGGTSGVTTVWQKCTSGCSSTDDTGWTNTTNTFSNLAVSTYFRAKVTSSTCGTKYSNTLTVPPVYPEFYTGTVYQPSSGLCSNQAITIYAQTASGGNGTPLYQWQEKIGSSFYDIYDENDYSYTIPTNTIPVGGSRTYRRLAKPSVSCPSSWVASNEVTVTVNGSLSSGTLQPQETICSGTSPGLIVGSAPSGGGGGYQYEWRVSTDGASWGAVVATTNSYDPPGNITLRTYYKRTVTSSCGGSAYSTTDVDVGTTAPGSITNYPSSACYDSGISGSFSISGNSGPVTWQQCTTDCSNSSNWFNVGSNVFGPLSITTQFRAKLNSELCGVKYTPVVTFNIKPGQASTQPLSGLYNASATLTATGANANETYKWYNSADTYIQCTGNCPTPVLKDATSFTYYATVVNTVSGCETPYSQKASLVINLYLDSPPAPIITSNTCGPKSVTMPAVNGVTWYWQGTNPNGQLTTPVGAGYTINSSGPFYIRGKANGANLWTTAATLSEASTKVDAVDITMVSYEPNTTLVQATHSITLSAAGGGFVIPAGSTFLARIAITSECNDFINWNESIVYNESAVPVASSKSYYDGLGKTLLDQSKDHLTKKVFASQPLYDTYGVVAAGTLPAPILEHDFIYKNNFVRNEAGNIYSASDFDLRTQTGASGEINNAKAVGEQPGTLGWYYSASNNLEPHTAVTDYPYSRTFTPEGPDPTITTSTGPGNAFKMGGSHEVKREKQKILVGELDHYYSLRQHFVATANSFSPNLLPHVLTNSTGYFPAHQGVSVTSANGYVTVTCAQTTSTPGTWPIGGTIAVTPGKLYRFSVKGYRASATNPTNVQLFVANGAGGDLVWPGALLPLGNTNEGWATTTFTVPAGVTTVKVGILWNGTNSNTNGQSFYVSAVDLRAEVPVASTGYKVISTNPDGKKVVTFVDADGRNLASATLDGTTFDNWSYSYYNDRGQLVATVAPNGVNTASQAYPPFVTLYKYDQLGRRIEATSADEGTSRFVYRSDGKIRFSQNEEQRTVSAQHPYPAFSYTNYDYLGRVIESGEYTSTTLVAGTPFVFDLTTASGANSVLHLVENVGYTGVSRKIDASRCTDYTYVEYDRENLAGITNPPTSFQTNLNGQISRTENENAITLYSYDEFGQLKRSWQLIKLVEPYVAKTVDYTYDYFGNVTEVIYQKDNADDRFYHLYAYDLNQRLVEVHTNTSNNASTKKLRAKYEYYLHGPLKRISLMDGPQRLQGIDYTYTINGALKTINHADPTQDPGADGDDVFGETLQYYDNDYQGAGYDAGNQTLSQAANQYSGLLKTMSWHSPVDNNQKRTYAYQYDSRNQLTNALWGSMTSAFPSYTFTTHATQEHFREAVPQYDKNGNIQSLIRKGKDGNSLANYAYVYEANKNKLDKVNNNGVQMIDYTHNSIGQLTKQDEGASKTFNIKYNAHGLMKEIRNSTNQLIQFYHYGDRGELLQEIQYVNGSPHLYTTFVNDVAGNALAIYQHVNATSLPAKAAQMPLYGGGRIAVYKPEIETYFYEVSDHLGNVRAVIGQPDTEPYDATMESEIAEEPPFVNIASRRVPKTPPGVPSGNEMVRMNNQYPAGPGISLKVSPGDVITMQAEAYYEAGVLRDYFATSTSLITTIAGMFGGISGAPGDPGLIYSGVQGGFTSLFVGSGGGVPPDPDDDDNAPYAYLTYMVLDANRVFKYGGSQRVSTAANMAIEQLDDIPTVTIEEPGYIYVFLYNRSESNNWVYFDNLSITHDHSTIVAGADYYPYGLAMEGRGITDEPYKYGYQGQFSEKDLTTGMQEFKLRAYDPRTGRWLSRDPYRQYHSPYLAMGNLPHMKVDPDGGSVPEVLEEIVITGTSYSSIASQVGAGLKTVINFAKAFCEPCPDPIWAELPKGSVAILENAEYVLEDPSKGKDGWVRVGGELKEVFVPPSLQDRLAYEASKQISGTLSSFMRFTSSLGSPIIQNVYLISKEGIHGGLQEENRVTWAKVYYLDNWDLQSYELQQHITPDQARDLFKAQVDVYTNLMGSPQLQIAGRTLPKQATDIVLDEIITGTTDYVLGP